MSIGASGTPPLSPAQILARLITVDGSGSGLDADTIDGINSTAISAALSRSAKTGTYTVILTDKGNVIDCTANTFTVNLTAAATLGDGFNCWVYNSGSGTITIDPASSETIRTTSGSSTTATLTQGQGFFLLCNGTGWYAVNDASTSGGGGSAVGFGLIDTATPVAITSVTTVTNSGKNKTHTVAATSAVYAVTLNTSSGWSAGDMIRFESSYSNTYMWTLNSSASIDGTVNRYIGPGETVILRWTGSTWVKAGGQTYPLRAKIYNTAGGNLVNTALKISMTSTAFSVAQMAGGSNQISIQRPGYYMITGRVFLISSSSTENVLTELYLNNASVLIKNTGKGAQLTSGGSSYYGDELSATCFFAAINDTVSMFCTSTGTLTVQTLESRTYLEAIEIPYW